MVKKALPLILFIGSLSLFAEELPGPPETDYCCYPSECYPPAYCGIECGAGLTADVEFLYWLVRETSLPIGGRVNIVSRNSTLSNSTNIALLEDLSYFKSKWNPGLRVGLDWDFGCDNWDLYLNWTYFTNKVSNTLSASFSGLQPVLGESGIVNPWSDAAAQAFGVSLTSLPLFEKVTGKLRLYYNQIDLLLGKTHWISPCFKVKYLAGLRGFWDRIRFEVKGSQGPKTASTTNSFISDFENITLNTFKAKQWSLGLIAGLQPSWYFTDCFLFFANLDISMGWGNFCQDVEESYYMAGVGGPNLGQATGPFVVINQANAYDQKFSQMTTFLDLAIGFRWERFWCCNRVSTALELAWEQHLLFEAASRLITFGSASVNDFQTFTGFIDNVGNLIFGGLVARFQFGF